MINLIFKNDWSFILRLVLAVAMPVALLSCSHGYIQARQETYNEKWSSTLKAQLEKSNPGYTFNVTSGPTDQATLISPGFTLGTYWNLGPRFVIDLDLFFGKANGVTSTYTYTGPTTGGGTSTINPTNAGDEVLFGYQAFSFLRPYAGLRSEVYSQVSAYATGSNSVGLTSQTVSQSFMLAGLAFQQPFTNWLSVSLTADYALGLTKSDPVSESNALTLQAGLRWNFSSDSKPLKK